MYSYFLPHRDSTHEHLTPSSSSSSSSRLSNICADVGHPTCNQCLQDRTICSKMCAALLLRSPGLQFRSTPICNGVDAFRSCSSPLCLIPGHPCLSRESHSAGLAGQRTAAPGLQRAWDPTQGFLSSIWIIPCIFTLHIYLWLSFVFSKEMRTLEQQCWRMFFLRYYL